MIPSHCLKILWWPKRGESGALSQQKHNSLVEEHANIIVNILLIITIGNLKPLETQYWSSCVRTLINFNFTFISQYVRCKLVCWQNNTPIRNKILTYIKFSTQAFCFLCCLWPWGWRRWRRHVDILRMILTACCDTTGYWPSFCSHIKTCFTSVRWRRTCGSVQSKFCLECWRS